MVELPDYLPVRMLNQFVYCPRLFYYEFVEGLFVHSADTVEGTIQHKRVDKLGKSSKRKVIKGEEAGEQEKPSEVIHHRSLTLSSESLKINAKMDLVEEEEGRLTPVDYKHSRPYRLDAPRKSYEATEDDEEEPEPGNESEEKEKWVVWPNDAVQVCAQGLVLRENGYDCQGGYVYYQASKQKIPVAFTDELILETRNVIENSRKIAILDVIPPPLVDNPKCLRCSLLPICMPEETGLLREKQPDQEPQTEIRRIIAARSDEGVLYVNTQGARINKSGSVLCIKLGTGILAETPLSVLRQISLFGNVQMTVQALHEILGLGIPVCHFSIRGWFYGISQGLPLKNVDLRRKQFNSFDDPATVLALSRKVIQAKILNQRTFLMRNSNGVDEAVFQDMKDLAGKASDSASLESLLGFEGSAARKYFNCFKNTIKVDVRTGAPGETPDGQERLPLPDFWEGKNIFDFENRNRRPPKDPINSLLSLAYSMLVKDMTVACYAVGLDPMFGFFHQPKFGRPALALDLMEEFRPLIADSVVLGLVNNRMLNSSHFLWGKSGCVLTDKGRAVFFEAYEKRKNSLVTHPLFGYRISYGRLLEVQARLLAKHLQGEVPDYVGFTTR